MKAPKYFLLYILFVSQIVFGQQGNLTLYGYDSEYEEKVINDVNSEELELLLALGEKASYVRLEKVKAVFNDFIKEVKQSGILDQTEVKLMKQLHNMVHDKFLVQYKEISPFHEIFETGTYNCVSATALFALTLDELNIPYNIQEQPTHVFIMAYPDTKGIMVEMTAVKDAYYMPTRRDISKAIKLLLDFKITTADEVNKLGEREVYNQYYNSNQEIDLRKLIGLQYYNEAIVNYNDGAHSEKAFNAICKSEKLYSSQKVELFKTEILINALDDMKDASMLNIRYMAEYSNFSWSNQQKVKYEYARMLDNQLVSNSNRAFADSSFTYLSKEIKDTLLNKELKEIYYLGMSDYFSHSYNQTKQFEYAEKAFELSPKNLATQSWYIRSMLNYVTNKYNEDEEVLEQLDHYKNKFEVIGNHNLFQMYYFYALVSASNDYFFDDDEENGIIYFNKAKEVRERMADKEVLDEYEVCVLYADYAAFLYRENRYADAIEILNEGVKVTPNCERITEKIEILKNTNGKNMNFIKKESNSNDAKVIFIEEK